MRVERRRHDNRDAKGGVDARLQNRPQCLCYLNKYISNIFECQLFKTWRIFTCDGSNDVKLCKIMPVITDQQWEVISALSYHIISSDLWGHARSSKESIVKCDISCSRAANDKISTDTTRHTVPRDWPHSTTNAKVSGGFGVWTKFL